MSDLLIDQPTAAPTRKVTAFAVAGGITAAIMAALEYFSPDMAKALGPLVAQAVPVVVGFVAAYFTRNTVA